MAKISKTGGRPALITEGQLFSAIINSGGVITAPQLTNILGGNVNPRTVAATLARYKTKGYVKTTERGVYALSAKGSKRAQSVAA